MEKKDFYVGQEWFIGPSLSTGYTNPNRLRGSLGYVAKIGREYVYLAASKENLEEAIQRNQLEKFSIETGFDDHPYGYTLMLYPNEKAFQECVIARHLKSMVARKIADTPLPLEKVKDIAEIIGVEIPSFEELMKKG